MFYLISKQQNKIANKNIKNLEIKIKRKKGQTWPSGVGIRTPDFHDLNLHQRWGWRDQI